MKTFIRLTVLIGALVLVSGVPAYARGGGGGHGGDAGGFAGGGHASGGLAGGHALGGSHTGFVGGGHDGHHFDGHHVHHDSFHGGAFIGVGPYWDPYWWDWPYGAYTYAPGSPSVEAPPVYVEKHQAGSCPGGAAYYPDAQSCPQPWVRVPPHAG